jgi:hypothetical protein
MNPGGLEGSTQSWKAATAATAPIAISRAGRSSSPPEVPVRRLDGADRGWAQALATGA